MDDPQELVSIYLFSSFPLLTLSCSFSSLTQSRSASLEEFSKIEWNDFFEDVCSPPKPVRNLSHGLKCWKTLSYKLFFNSILFEF